MKLNLIFIAPLFLMACNKEPGKGGTSTIHGTVTGKEYKFAESEITEVIVTSGADIEHGDYWLLNNANNELYFYIWYNNLTWVSNGDPQLEGRTGIQVDYYYGDSNTEIGQKTLDALVAATGIYFEMNLNTDVITISNNFTGDTPDANKVSTNFDINIANQGKNSWWSNQALSLVNEDVYITYGNQEIYGDKTSTGGDGEFKFTNLVKGDYSIYVMSQDTLNPDIKNKVVYKISVTENKSIQDLGTISIVY